MWLTAAAYVAAEEPHAAPVIHDSWPAYSTLISVADMPSVAAPKAQIDQPESHDVTFNLSGGSPADKNPRGFRVICDCGCGIECLDKWCDCETTCCTTDQWCGHPCECSHGNCYRTAEGCWVSNDGECDIWGYDEDAYTTAFRLGGWGVVTQGSLNGIGEYDDLQSSPFFDVDGLSSNGDRTLDFVLSGFDNETNNAQVAYYGPGMSGKVRFNRFLHRLDHDPLQGFPRPTPPAVPGPSDNVIVEDLNVGEDYAIRVQQLDARFQGRMSDNVKWRLNLWGMRKFGERQANATAHCFNVNAPAPAGATGNVCHVLSQRQSIDWTTMEIQPVVEAQFENVTVEYSRTMRSFGQSDDNIFRQYSRFNFNLPSASGQLGPDYQYGIVPESFTQIDRLKVNAMLTDTQHVYANMYVGDTHNQFRDTHRQYGGYDVRYIDRSFDQLTSTAYVSMYDENNELPPFFFNSPPLSSANVYDEESIRHPVDYHRFRTGLKGNWRPDDSSSIWRIVGGYEYFLLARDFATYPTAAGEFTQPDTRSHQIEIGPAMRWSEAQSGYVRYRARLFEVPLIGVREFNGRFNTKQPEQDHRIEIGGTWSPTDNLSATAQVSVVNAWHYSEFANFNEDSYPFYLTLWHAPTDRLSLTGGYAYFSNWIDQDITLGFAVPTVPPPLQTFTETTRWNYRGENHLISLNANYAWTATVHLVGGYEWNRGINAFTVPSSTATPPADWSLLSSLADVIIETQRATLGADWQPYDNLTVYARYIYYDWNDIGSGLNSGTAHMALGGASIIW